MYTIVWAQPYSRASSALASDPTVPIIVTPSARAHWQAISPTPPAAAWNRIVSPDSTRLVRRNRYCTVSPFSISVAAVRSAMPSGSLTSLSAGITRAVLYAPGGPPAYATRSPGFTQSTPVPTASTTPAASLPMPDGSASG